MHAFTSIAGTTRPPRRSFFALLTALGLILGLSLAAPAQSAETDQAGLFGTADPTYDGVYRQSMAILGLTSTGSRAPKPAVAWLLRQQCADGSFGAHRENPSEPCAPPDPTTFTGPDTNSTAVAIMALRALSESKAQPLGEITRALKRATGWLKRQQVDAGGWEWIRGLSADSTSTGMAMAALGRSEAVGVRKGAAWLRNEQIMSADCALPFQPEGPADPLSTSWALIGAQGSLPYDRHRGPRTLTPCEGTPPSLLASGNWLATSLITGQGRIASAFTPDETDWNSTALATLGISQAHGSTAAMRLGVTALQANVLAYTRTSTGDMPAAVGTLLMVAHATGSDPTDFGGVDLRRQLLATLQK